MTDLSRDEFLCIAREAGIPFNKYGLVGGDSCERDIDDEIERFYELARAPLVAENVALRTALPHQYRSRKDWYSWSTQTSMHFQQFEDLSEGQLAHLNNDYANALSTYLIDTNKLRSERDALKAELAQMKAGEPVLWQYRWTNPTGDSYQDKLTGWELVKPAWNQTVQQKCDELLAYRYDGKPIYEVRALFTAAQQPSAVAVVEELVEAFTKFNGECYDKDGYPKKEISSIFVREIACKAIAAGQQFMKESNHAD